MTKENNADFEQEDTVIDSEEQLLNLINDKPESEEEQDKAPASSQDEKEEEDSPSSQGNDETEEKSDEDNSDEDSKNDDENKDIPFHKHPRFKEVISKKNELESKLNEKDEAINDLKERLTNLEKAPKSDGEMSPEFVQLFGDNKEAYDVWQSMTKKERLAITQDEEIVNTLVDKVVSKLEAKKQEDEKAVNEAQTFVNSEIQRLKDSGESFDEKKLKEVMAKYQPGDGDNLDFDKGLEIYKVLETSTKKSKQSRKAIADMTNSNSTDTKEPEFYTPGFSRKPGF